MLGWGDGVVVLLAIVAVVYGIYMAVAKKLPLYFQLSVAAVACLLLGYVFDICDYLVNPLAEEGYIIGYLGSTGSFLFLLTASIGYMDGIIDDGSPQMKKAGYIAWIAPAVAVLLWVPNLFAQVPMMTKAVYTVLWIPAAASSYFSLKHAIVPDMGFGFVKAIRPYNISALCFTLLQLLHLTIWNFGDWVTLLISGIVFGSSCIVMVIMADRGIKRWVL